MHKIFQGIHQKGLKLMLADNIYTDKPQASNPSRTSIQQTNKRHAREILWTTHKVW